jgi:hypothetical protein
MLSMRALLLTGSPARPVAPLQLTAEQIVAGPHWPDAQTRDGQWISLRTPRGEYDLALVLSKIPADQWPDLLVSLADASGSQPRNLSCFSGPKILLLPKADLPADGAIDALQPAGGEPFDRVVPLHANLRIAS